MHNRRYTPNFSNIFIYVILFSEDGDDDTDEDPNNRVSLTRRLSRVFVLEGAEEHINCNEEAICVPGTSGVHNNPRNTIISLVRVSTIC